MSKEFEEIVLKKLDALETKTNAIQVQMGTLQAQTDVLQTKMGALEETTNDVVLKKLNTLEAKADALEETTNNTVLKKLNILEEKTLALEKTTNSVVLKKLNTLETKSDVLEEEISSTNKVVREIQQDFAKFDYDINTKIDTLFDAYTVNQEKHIFFGEKIASLDSKTFNHDIRISNLENKVLTT